MFHLTHRFGCTYRYLATSHLQHKPVICTTQKCHRQHPTNKTGFSQTTSFVYQLSVLWSVFKFIERELHSTFSNSSSSAETQTPFKQFRIWFSAWLSET